MKKIILFGLISVLMIVFELICVNSCSPGQPSSSTNSSSSTSVFVQPVFTLIGSWSGPNQEFIDSVYVDADDTIYAVAKYDGLFILTNPGPVKAGKFQTNYYPVNDVVVNTINSKKYAFAALGVYNQNSGIIVLNVNDPTNIIVTNALINPNLSCNAILDFIGSAGAPVYNVYTADDNKGFQDYNVNFTTAATALGTAMISTHPAVDIALSSDNSEVFLAAKTAGIFVVNITTGSTIFQINNYPISSIQALSVSGNNLAAVDSLNGILIYDVASYPKLKANYSTPGEAYDVVMNGNDIYIADGSYGILKVSWTPPSTFSLDRVYQDGAVYYKLYYSSSTGYLYAACGKSGIRILMETN